jgi:hypothetical protein
VDSFHVGLGFRLGVFDDTFYRRRWSKVPKSLVIS